MFVNGGGGRGSGAVNAFCVCVVELNMERAYKKASSSTLLASILKSRVRVTVMKEKCFANFAF